MQSTTLYILLRTVWLTGVATTKLDSTGYVATHKTQHFQTVPVLNRHVHASGS